MSKAILIQARTSSQRFPGKMLEEIKNDIALVEYVYQRCLQSKKASVVAVITSEESSDDQLFNYCQSQKIKVFRGPLNNVLERYIKAADHFQVKTICRVSGDTPFVDVRLMDEVFGILESSGFDYAAPDRNSCAPGFYFEITTLEALKKASQLASTKEDVEHVTKFILDHQEMFKVRLLDPGLNPEVLKKVRFTVDYPDDIHLCRKLAGALKDDYSFTSQDVIEAIKKFERV